MVSCVYAFMEPDVTATLDHYNRTAQRYTEINHTLPSARQDVDHFLGHLRAQPHFPSDRPLRLLDAGSGSGRDTLTFLQEGFEVDAFDGSEAMAAISSKLTGQPTRVMQFEALDLPSDHYDAVWAMASLLHVDRGDLPGVFAKLGQSLRPGGLLFASFKHGHDTRVDERDGRVFTDLNEAGVEELLERVEGFEVMATAHRDPPAAQTNAAPWFSVILKRPGPAPVLRQATRRGPGHR